MMKSMNSNPSSIIWCGDKCASHFRNEMILDASRVAAIKTKGMTVDSEMINPYIENSLIASSEQRCVKGLANEQHVNA